MKSNRSVLTESPKIRRVDALWRSMLSIITIGKDFEAHPALGGVRPRWRGWSRTIGADGRSCSDDQTSWT